MSKKLMDLKGFTDGRGLLVALESNMSVPFDIKRIYYLTDLKKSEPRGFHAHKNLKQLAVCLHGSCRFILDDGKTREEFVLSSPTQGLLIEEMYWREMDQFSNGCVILVLASELYDESDYIRDYNEFKKRVL
jgi:UDP-2-acetamido-3-amino-2,3-dideoxy-glucuronate N-acetyltransferase